MTGWYVQWTRKGEVGYLGPATSRRIARNLKRVIIEACSETEDEVLMFEKVVIGRFEGGLFLHSR